MPIGIKHERCYVHERIAYALLAVVVGLVTVGGAFTLTDSRTTEEPH